MEIETFAISLSTKCAHCSSQFNVAGTLFRQQVLRVARSQSRVVLSGLFSLLKLILG